jgi:hypothetical protein
LQGVWALSLFSKTHPRVKTHGFDLFKKGNWALTFKQKSRQEQVV